MLIEARFTPAKKSRAAPWPLHGRSPPKNLSGIAYNRNRAWVTIPTSRRGVYQVDPTERPLLLGLAWPAMVIAQVSCRSS